MSQLFASDDQNTGASASASVLPTSIQGWLLLRLTDLLVVQGNFRSLLQHHSSKAWTLWHSAFTVQLSQLYMTTGKTMAKTIRTLVSRLMSLLFNTLSTSVSVLLPRSTHRLISWLQSPPAVTSEPRRGNLSLLWPSPSICHEVTGLDAMILVILIFSFKLALSLSSLNLIKRLFSSFLLSAFRVVSSTYLGLLILLLPILMPVCNSSNPAFLMMCSAYRLNKQGDSRQPSRTPFSILKLSVVPYRVLTVASWPTYKFLRREVRCSVIPTSFKGFPQFIMIHTVKGFSTVDETEGRCFSEIP